MTDHTLIAACVVLTATALLVNLVSAVGQFWLGYADARDQALFRRECCAFGCRDESELWFCAKHARLHYSDDDEDDGDAWKAGSGEAADRGV